ncbi:hypothetical protein M3Y95_01099200 [Aphelenchoides besseyi]|nr:hypothetical protein M3Y95_01099200 [Aphelenchoides besseyi]
MRLQLLLHLLLYSLTHAVKKKVHLSSKLATRNQVECNWIDAERRLILNGGCPDNQLIQANRRDLAMAIDGDAVENNWLNIKIRDCSFNFTMHGKNGYKVDNKGLYLEVPFIYVIRSNATVRNKTGSIVYASCQLQNTFIERPLIQIGFGQPTNEILVMFPKEAETIQTAVKSNGEWNYTDCQLTINKQTGKTIQICPSSWEGDSFGRFWFFGRVPYYAWITMLVVMIVCCMGSSTFCAFFSFCPSVLERKSSYYRRTDKSVRVL